MHLHATSTNIKAQNTQFLSQKLHWRDLKNWLKFNSNRFEVLMMVHFVTPCTLYYSDCYWLVSCFVNSSTLKMGAASFFETSLNLYQITRRHFPEDSTLLIITFFETTNRIWKAINLPFSIIMTNNYMLKWSQCTWKQDKFRIKFIFFHCVTAILTCRRSSSSTKYTKRFQNYLAQDINISNSWEATEILFDLFSTVGSLQLSLFNTTDPVWTRNPATVTHSMSTPSRK